MPVVEDWLCVLDICLVAIFSRFVSYWFYRLKLPRILGDIMAGVLLGPSLMGETLNSQIFPQRIRPVIRLLGNLGLMMASMTAGSNFDRRVLRGQFLKVGMYTFFNIAVPTILTIPLFFLLPATPGIRGSRYIGLSFYLYLSSVVCASALPFVFLILDELKIFGSIARFAIGYCCLSMIALFTMISVATTCSKPVMDMGALGRNIGILFVSLFGMFLIQRIWGRLIKRLGPTSFVTKATTDQAVLIVAMCLAFGVVTERTDYSFILGAFLAGAALPFNEGVRTTYGRQIKWLARWILLPMYFLNVGLAFNIRAVGLLDIPFILLVVAWCFIAKACLIPIAMVTMKLSFRDSCFCAALANIRGYPFASQSAFNALVIGSTARLNGQFGPTMFIIAVLSSLISSSAGGPLARMFKPAPDKAPEEEAEPEPAPKPKSLEAPGAISPAVSPLGVVSGAEEWDHTSTASPFPPGSSTASATASPQPAAAQEMDLIEFEPAQHPGGTFLGSGEGEMHIPILFVEDLLDNMRHHTRSAKRGRGVVSGKAAVTFLVKNEKLPTRAVAIDVCQKLIQMGFLAHATTKAGDTGDAIVIPKFLDEENELYTIINRDDCLGK